MGSDVILGENMPAANPFNNVSSVAPVAANPFNNVAGSSPNTGAANPFSNVGTGPVAANPFNNIPNSNVAVAPLQPTPGMSVIPSQQPSAAPTFIISTTDEDLKRDGFVEQGVMPTMPLGQPDMQGPAPEQTYPRRTVRRTKPTMIAPNPFNNMGSAPPVSQTPHTGGYDNTSYSAYPEEERAVSAPSPSGAGTGGFVKVEKLG
jgi:hypothetical protein